MMLDIKRKSSNAEKTAEIKKVLEEYKNAKFTIAMAFDENTKLINKITIVSNEFLKQKKKLILQKNFSRDLLKFFVK